MSTYLDVIQFEAYVAGCAADSGVSVQWDDPDSTPRTNGKVMYLPKLTTATSSEWLTRMRYFVKHETSHIVHSDFDYLNKVRPEGLLALINNLIEDHRIDYRNDKEYFGDVDISNKFWTLYTQDIENRVTSTDAELSKQQLLTLPLFVWDAIQRDWITNASDTHISMLSKLDAKGMEKLDKLDKYSAELVTVRQTGNAAEVFDLAKRILKDLYDADAADYVEKPKAESGKGKAKGKGDGAEEDGDSDSEDRLIDVEKLTKDIGHEHKPSRTGVHLKTDRSVTRGAYSIPRPNDYTIIRFPELHNEVRRYVKSGYFKSVEVSEYITSNARPMANKLRIKLQTRSKGRYEYGKKKGTLHNGSLHRILQGDTGVADRVFRKHVVSDTTDTAVCLLVDCSGSMSGKKFETACSGAGALAECLKPLNIQYTTLGFTNTQDKEEPIIWVFNDYGERIQLPELVSRFAMASGCLWQNSDGDAIAYATHTLHQRKEKRKVLIVLSDGSPAGRDWAGDVDAYTLRTVQHAEKTGIDVYGIGIQDTNVKRFYTNNVVVNNLEELSPSILKIIDRSL
jgi:hypothetical protein